MSRQPRRSFAHLSQDGRSNCLVFLRGWMAAERQPKQVWAAHTCTIEYKEASMWYITGRRYMQLVINYRPVHARTCSHIYRRNQWMRGQVLVHTSNASTPAQAMPGQQKVLVAQCILKIMAPPQDARWRALIHHGPVAGLGSTLAVFRFCDSRLPQGLYPLGRVSSRAGDGHWFHWLPKPLVGGEDGVGRGQEEDRRGQVGEKNIQKRATDFPPWYSGLILGLLNADAGLYLVQTQPKNLNKHTPPTD